MIRFTQFHVLDRYDSTIRIPMLMLSFANKFQIYHVVRRRFLSSILHSVGVPHEQINSNNLIGWIDSSTYIVDEAEPPADIGYAKACDLTQDRYDMNIGMRNVLMTTSVHNRSLDYITRDIIGRRVSVLIDSYTKRVDPDYAHSHRSEREPHSQFKGAYYYGLPAFIQARDAFRDFGHMVAHYRAGGDDYDIDEIRTKFFELDGKYPECSSHIGSAYDGASGAAEERLEELEITHCDCGHYEHESDTHTVRNDEWCQSCFDDEAVYCEDNDEYWPRDDAYYSDNDDCYYT